MYIIITKGVTVCSVAMLSKDKAFYSILYMYN